MGVLRKIFKSYSEKEVKRVMPIVEQINKLEPEMEKLTDKELTGKTEYFKKQLEEGKTLMIYYLRLLQLLGKRLEEF